MLEVVLNVIHRSSADALSGKLRKDLIGFGPKPPKPLNPLNLKPLIGKGAYKI